MKQSHYTTPRTLDESNFYYVGYSQRRADEQYFAIDTVVYILLVVVLFGFLLGYFS